jgi:hypothetical protein
MTIAIGDRVEAGEPGTQDYDRGVVQTLTADRAEVAWDSGTTTRISVHELTVLPPARLHGANLAVNEGTPHV